MFEKSEARQRLSRLFEAGRVFHAYVITGSGRETFARDLAAALVCGGEKKPCGSCGHCKKVEMNIHPDITEITIAEDKREILVDQIRQLRSDVYIRPNEAERKVYIIQPAEAMNDNAQNAFLKVLEEGPSYACFLLVTEQAGALLPTVRSRCEEIFLREAEKEVSRDPRAEELAGLLLKGSEKQVLEFCIGMEKEKREEISLLLRDTVLVLNEMMRQDIFSAAEIGRKIDLLKQMQQAAEYNVGTGHLTGWLCAACFQ